MKVLLQLTIVPLTALVLGCGESTAIPDSAKCPAIRAEPDVMRTLPEDCVTRLFTSGHLRLPHLPNYGPPAFEIRRISPTSIVADYPPRHREQDPTILLGASETDLTSLPDDSPVTLGGERTEHVGNVEVLLAGQQDSRGAEWIYDGIAYRANASSAVVAGPFDDTLLQLVKMMTDQ